MVVERGRPLVGRWQQMTINLEPGPARIPAFLRQEIGVDPNDAAVILDLAAIGITNGAWRNSQVEDWHGDGRIYDGGMLRTNVATTKLVREVLDDHLGEVVDDEGDVLFATEDLADLDSELSDELFLDIFERLSDPERVLPDGRTLRKLAGEDLDGGSRGVVRGGRGVLRRCWHRLHFRADPGMEGRTWPGRVTGTGLASAGLR